jgi:site-specific DNA recombinase
VSPQRHVADRTGRTGGGTADRQPARRAVIYARYSDDLQRAESIADQIEVCRRYAEQQGWTVIATYDDAARSGGSRFRPGFQRLLADAEAKRFDVIVCEAIDRLGRKLADVADFHDRVVFHQVQLYTPSIGQITPLHIAVMGMMAQLFLSDLRDKTKRGQLGRALAGRIPGGLAYGYDVVPPLPGAKEAGERRINPAEAAIVLRIFHAYANGQSPRDIAHDLNSTGVPGPGGRTWGDTTIRGQVDRGTGILNNTLYVGLLSWNRCSYVKDPSTGKRVARVNPVEKREQVAVTALRIVEDSLWQQVRVRQQELRYEMAKTEDGNSLNRAHRRKFLLSGLLVCGGCGGGYTVVAQDRYGCATRRSKGTCDNARTIDRKRIEARVLSGLKERLLAPDLIAAAVVSYNQELRETQKEAGQKRSGLERQIADTDRSLGGILKAIEAGAWSTTLQDRLAELEARKKTLRDELAASGAATEEMVIDLDGAKMYRKYVADLEATLNDDEVRTEAADLLRGLIDRVVLIPDPTAPDGLRGELNGAVAEILLLSERVPGVLPLHAGRKKPPGTLVSGGQLSVVAGTGFEPVTFRL